MGTPSQMAYRNIEPGGRAPIYYYFGPRFPDAFKRAIVGVFRQAAAYHYGLGASADELPNGVTYYVGVIRHYRLIFQG